MILFVKTKNKINQTNSKIKNTIHNNIFILIDNLLHKNQNKIIANAPTANKILFSTNTEIK
ncbi:hypothetical protein CQA49_09580 [Helicobacter sp. MIT 00-7814]|nr:hypothetical protein CQA49_09580 [Helicobacter sp. MIT 00-7814]RDU52002.1 hypothetical protein CQA37_09075 [Helicobacter sp. MIT 99-10781]